LSEKK